MTIVLIQSTLLYVSWLIFAKVIADLFEGFFRKIIFIVVLCCAYGQQYYFLNHYILSDSLAMSTMLFFLSAVISFKKISTNLGNNWAIFTLFITAFFTLGTRDSNIILVVFGTILTLLLYGKLLSYKQSLLLILPILAIVNIQSANSVKRHEFNISNIIAGFVLQSPEVSSFFYDKGLPKSLHEYKPLEIQERSNADYHKIHETKLENNLVVSFSQAGHKNNSYLTDASKIYISWLITHPVYVFKQIYQDAEYIFGQSFSQSTAWNFAKEKTSYNTLVLLDDKVPPIVQGVKDFLPFRFIKTKIVFAILFSLILFVLCFISKDAHIKVSLFLMLSGASNAIISYFFDLWEPSEMMRHALIGSVIFNTGFWIALASILFSINKIIRERN